MGARKLGADKFGFRQQVVNHMNSLHLLNVCGNLLLDFPPGANSQHGIIHSLGIINLETPPNEKTTKLAKTLYSLLLVHPGLDSWTLKFLITNPAAFLERSILEKLSEVDAIKQAIIAEFLCKWVTVDKNFHQQYKKWHKLLSNH